MQTLTKNASRFQTMKIDTSILNKREFTCLDHIYLLKIETGELDYYLYPPLNPHVLLWIQSCIRFQWLLDPNNNGLWFHHNVAYFLNMVRLNIDQTEANLIEQGFNIFGCDQADQIVNYLRANLPGNHPALIY